MSIRRTRLAALVAAVALGLTACGGGGASSEQSTPTDTSTKLATQAQYNPQPRENLKEGGTLTTAVAEITPQFNTFQADGTLYTLILWRWYNPNLAYFAPDGTYSPNPDYLTDVKKEEVNGNTVVTYTINPKATYNDGAPIDWKSFEATWKANNGQNEAYLASSTDGYSKIKSVTQGTDARQAVVTFEGVYAWVDGLFNVLLNPKAADPDVYNKGYVNNPRAEWGAGPYTIDEVDMKTGRVSFKRNDRWWGDKGMLDKRVFMALESSASINAFKNGQLDATSVASKDRLAQVQGMTGIEIRKSATPSLSLIVVNAGDPALKDANVRKAVFMSIDRSVLANIEFNGLDYTEEPPGSFVLYPFQAGYVDNLTAAGYKFDAAAANTLLDQAGWTRGADGIRAKDGEKFSIVYPIIGDDPTSQAQAKAVNSMLKEVGIEVVLEQHPSSDFSKVFLSKKYGLFAMGFSSSDPFGFAYFCQVYCKDSSLNASGTGTEEFDQKIGELSKVGDPQQQIEQGNKLEQEIMAAAWGILPTANGPTMIATKTGLANYGASLFYVGPVQNIGWQK